MSFGRLGYKYGSFGHLGSAGHSGIPPSIALKADFSTANAEPWFFY